MGPEPKEQGKQRRGFMVTYVDGNPTCPPWHCHGQSRLCCRPVSPHAVTRERSQLHRVANSAALGHPKTTAANRRPDLPPSTFAPVRTRHKHRPATASYKTLAALVPCMGGVLRKVPLKPRYSAHLGHIVVNIA